MGDRLNSLQINVFIECRTQMCSLLMGIHLARAVNRFGKHGVAVTAIFSRSAFFISRLKCWKRVTLSWRHLQPHSIRYPFMFSSQLKMLLFVSHPFVHITDSHFSLKFSFSLSLSHSVWSFTERRFGREHIPKWRKEKKEEEEKTTQQQPKQNKKYLKIKCLSKGGDR